MSAMTLKAPGTQQLLRSSCLPVFMPPPEGTASAPGASHTHAGQEARP